MAKVVVRQDRISSNLSAARLRTKKRSRDLSKTVVAGLITLLLVQGASALYLSPLFAVSVESLDVKASPLCTESEIRNLIQPELPRSIMRLPTSRWSDALGNIPAVKSAKITISFPNKLNVIVVDRQARLVSELGSLGKCVLDGDLVPFRTAVPADDLLPSLILQSENFKPDFGVCVADGAQVAGVHTLTKWLNDHPDVSAASINIQNNHLAFVISKSNVNVLLGTPRRLREKLDSLAILVEKRPDLLTSRKYSAVNLFSDEYPALVIRSESAEKSAVP
jgi:hypothetical protein